MFNLFNRTKVDDVVVPQVKPMKKDPEIFYTVGVTDDGRISFSLGTHPFSKTIFMNRIGVKGLIKILESSLSLLEPEDVVDDIMDDEITQEVYDREETENTETTTGT